MPQTVRLGSQGPDVARWQGIVGAQTDGKFGPKTQALTVEWQKQHKLVPDGVVGPATWGVALDEPAPDVGEQLAQDQLARESSVRHANADSKAYELARTALPALSEAERQYAIAVARGEGFYGRGWSTPSAATIELSKQFGLTGLEGADSNNWGAEQGTGDAGSFSHVDRHADGKPYVGKYRKHSSPARGLQSFAQVLFSGGKRGVAGARELREAIARGSLHDAVHAQHANGYFELNPSKYLAAVVRNYGIATTNTGWKPLLAERAPSSSGGGGTPWLGGTVAALLAVGAAIIFGRRS